MKILGFIGESRQHIYLYMHVHISRSPGTHPYKAPRSSFRCLVMRLWGTEWIYPSSTVPCQCRLRLKLMEPYLEKTVGARWGSIGRRFETRAT